MNESDGMVCRHCGDDAVDALWVLGHEYPVPLCGSCMDRAVTFCGRCERRIWSQDGERVFSTSTLYCPRCAEEILQAVKNHRLPNIEEIRR